MSATLNTAQKRRMVLGGLVVVAAVVGAYTLAAYKRSSVESEGLIPWVTDYQQGLERARQRGKPMLIDYTASWCPPCQRMITKVYSSQKVADRITDQFVPVKQDVDTLSQGETKLADRLGIRAIPVLVVMSADGQEITRYAGYVPRDRLLAWFDSMSEG